ncbi:hypothetical protein [Porphyromonas macacae]|nr:hypothetical protein [Porphyromonas macacae]
MDRPGGYVKPNLIIMKLKKILLGVFVALSALIAGSSAILPVNNSMTGLSLGASMPRMKSHMSDLTDLAPEKGVNRFTLVHFWAAYDNASRAENIVWKHFFNATLSDKIGYRAISLDTNQEVFEGTLALDHMDLSNQMWINPNDREEVLDLFGLKQSFHTYLIDDHGIVRAVDPTPDQLNYFYLN